MTMTIVNEVLDIGGQMTTKATKAQNAAPQWWKAWVLLTGVGVTVAGWMALPRAEAPPAYDVIPSQMSMPADNVRVVGVERVGLLPGAPVKPAFQAPVTRTRRS